MHMPHGMTKKIATTRTVKEGVGGGLILHSKETFRITD